MVKDRDFSSFSYEPILLEKILRRISIPRGQVTLLKALYEAEGEFVPREELIEQIRWGDPKSFTGVLAAFSGRIKIHYYLTMVAIERNNNYRMESIAKEAL